MGDWKAVRLRKDAPIELYNLRSRSRPNVTTSLPPTRRRQEDRAYLASARTDNPQWPIK